MTEVKNVLQRFVTHVVNQSKRNLTIKSINTVRKSLHRSIKGDIKDKPDRYEVGLYMEDYGKFVDRGVKGVERGRSLSGYKFKNHSNPFKKGARVIPPAFETDKIGRPLSFGSGRAMAINTWKFGIKPTEFFTKPFEAAYANLPDEVIEAYGLDIESEIEFNLNK